MTQKSQGEWLQLGFWGKEEKGTWINMWIQCSRPPVNCRMSRWPQIPRLRAKGASVGNGVALTDLLTTEPLPLQPAAQMLQNMEKIQVEQKRMKTQGEKLGWRDGVLEPWGPQDPQASLLILVLSPHPIRL